MGRPRKRSPPPAAASASASGAASGAASASPIPTVWTYLRQAGEALDRGNCGEALELVDQACLHYDTEPLAHLVRSAVYSRVAAGEHAEKQRLLQLSFKSTVRATVLCPSILRVCSEVAQLCGHTPPTNTPNDFVLACAANLLNLTTSDIRTLRGDAEAIYRQQPTRGSFEHHLAGSGEKSRKLYPVSINDLEAAAHESNLDGHHAPLLKEALTFAEAEGTFVLWVCSCTEKFSSPDALITHVMQQHIGILSPELQALLPQPAPSDWIQRSSHWHTLDFPTLKRVASSKERTDLLQKVGHLFKNILDHGILTASHVNEMVTIAMTEIHRLPYPSYFVLQKAKVEEWNACICVMDIRGLNKIINFLEYISKKTIYRDNRGDHSRVDRMAHLQENGQETRGQEQLIPGKTDVILSLDSNHKETLAHWLHAPSADRNNILSPGQAFKSREYERLEILTSLWVVFASLQDLCKMKQKTLNCIRALQDCIPLSEEELKKRKGKLADARDANDSLLRDALAGILWDVQRLKVIKPQSYMCEAMSSKLMDLSFLSLHQDGLIMLVLKSMRHLKLEFINASQFDYSKVIMPLMKSCLQRHMDNPVKEDGSEELMEETEDWEKNNGGANRVKSGLEAQNNKKKALRRNGTKERFLL